MNLSLFAVTDKVAIVTGGGRGIGKAIALGLAQAGADVVVAARTGAEIDNTAAEIRTLGRKALSVPSDVRSSDQVTNMVDKTLAEFGYIDILVNNAGGSFNVPLLEMSEGAWEAIVRENLKSVFLCSQKVAKVMKEQHRGSIINIASVAGLGSYSPNASYGAAKAGIINLTKTLAVDLAPYRVRVNAIAPGFIGTAGVARLFPREFLAPLESRIPLGYLGKPEDITGAVIYLASEASAYITGTTIVIDGGLTSRLD